MIAGVAAALPMNTGDGQFLPSYPNLHTLGGKLCLCP